MAKYTGADTTVTVSTEVCPEVESYPLNAWVFLISTLRYFQC